MIAGEEGAVSEAVDSGRTGAPIEVKKEEVKMTKLEVVKMKEDLVSFIKVVKVVSAHSALWCRPIPTFKPSLAPFTNFYHFY